MNAVPFQKHSDDALQLIVLTILMLLDVNVQVKDPQLPLNYLQHLFLAAVVFLSLALCKSRHGKPLESLFKMLM